jgi:hypothetical protein
MYDYGIIMNKKLYNIIIPPEYPIDKIIVPTYLIYSKEDSIATPDVCLTVFIIKIIAQHLVLFQDVELLYNKLNPRAKIYGKLMVTGINHVDFHYGIHRKEKVFNKIKQLLEKI